MLWGKDIGCGHCKYFNRNTLISCKAYPDIIPHEIISGEVDHTKPYKNDNGIRFEYHNDINTNKIEIDANTLNKKEIWIPQTVKRVGHRRKISTRKKEVKKEITPLKTSMISENVEKICSGMEKGIEGFSHEEKTYSVDFKDGSTGIYKVLNFVDMVGETNYYNISNIIKWNICPETVETDFGYGLGSCQKWISDVKEPYMGWDSDEFIKINENHFGDISKIFAVDALLGNLDRHRHNIAIKDNKCYSIDNEDWGNIDTAEWSLRGLDNACGLPITEGIKFNHIIDWIGKSISKDQFIIFRNQIISDFRNIIKYEDKILKYYKQYNKYEDVSSKIENIKQNFKYIKKYLKEINNDNNL